MKEIRTAIVEDKTRREVISELLSFLRENPDIKKCYVRYEGGWILSNISKPENTTNKELEIGVKS